MPSEVNRFIVNLEFLDPETRKNIMSLQLTHSISLEDAIRKYLESDDTLENVFHCPICDITLGRKIPLKGLPIIEAEKRGFIKLHNDQSRKWAQELKMFFAVCPKCLWWGTPDSTTVRNSNG